MIAGKQIIFVTIILKRSSYVTSAIIIVLQNNQVKI